MKFKFRYVLIGLAAILLLAVGGFVVWAANPLGPEEQALVALESDELVSVSRGEFIVFKPTDIDPETGLIFYPGGRVDYRSYAPALREIAADGYLVVLIPAPLNLMVFAPDKADEVIPQYPHVVHWAVGGHSLGGAMAAQYAGGHVDKVEGLLLWASYPASNNDLSESGLKVLSIYGTLDMGGMQPFDDSRALLPANTTWLVIEGGNHAQFGDYGSQPGDNPATISAADQQAQVVSATVEFLDALDD
ncbi:MAG: alpha/beta hydrolase [Anaerolineales bacterium]|jgi:pimeloyl-ACP methyl ester carboxylesterase